MDLDEMWTRRKTVLNASLLAGFRLCKTFDEGLR